MHITSYSKDPARAKALGIKGCVIGNTQQNGVQGKKDLVDPEDVEPDGLCHSMPAWMCADLLNGMQEIDDANEQRGEWVRAQDRGVRLWAAREGGPADKLGTGALGTFMEMMAVHSTVMRIEDVPRLVKLAQHDPRMLLGMFDSLLVLRTQLNAKAAKVKLGGSKAVELRKELVDTNKALVRMTARRNESARVREIARQATLEKQTRALLRTQARPHCSVQAYTRQLYRQSVREG
jgi:hypothetical protein